MNLRSAKSSRAACNPVSSDISARSNGGLSLAGDQLRQELLRIAGHDFDPGARLCRERRHDSLFNPLLPAPPKVANRSVWPA